MPLINTSQDEIHKIALKSLENIGKVEVLWSKLYLISPESDVHHLKRETSNPCWVIRLRVNDRQMVQIYDAVVGDYVGTGIIPPDSAFSFSGPWYSEPCDGSWDSWYLSAATAFEQFGYLTSSRKWANRDLLQAVVSNSDIKLFYEMAHGNSDTFTNGCTPEQSFKFTFAYDIKNWISRSDKKSFSFIGSCEGLCYTGSNTFSYEFRKGSNEQTATVGYCGMSTEHCDSCWISSVNWQNALFNYIKSKKAVKVAFDRAVADFPECIEPPACIRFAGDEHYALPIKEYMLIKKAPPHIEITWYPPNVSTLYYKQSLFDEFQILFSGVTPPSYHTDALSDDNNYYYIFEIN